MAEVAYNNAKNASTSHTPFELNCGYHSRMSYEEKVDPRSKSKSADELSAELKELIIVCQENLYYAQKLQKRVHNKGIKLEAILPVTKFGWIANISKPNKIESWKWSSLDHFESYIL